MACRNYGKSCLDWIILDHCHCGSSDVCPPGVQEQGNTSRSSTERLKGNIAKHCEAPLNMDWVARFYTCLQNLAWSPWLDPSWGLAGRLDYCLANCHYCPQETQCPQCMFSSLKQKSIFITPTRQFVENMSTLIKLIAWNWGSVLICCGTKYYICVC